MSLRTITLTVDQSKFFDEVSQHGLINSTCPIGSRVIACLLGGVDWREAMGLGVYGVSVIEEQPQPTISVEAKPVEAELTNAMRQLYGAEINCCVSSFFDTGWHAYIGDEMNGRKAEETFWPEDFNQIGDWLLLEAEHLYPTFKRQSARPPQPSQSKGE